MLPRVKHVGNEAALKQALYQGLCARQQTIDVRNYMVSPSEIAEIYRQVLNDNPDLFYVNGGLTWNYSGAYVNYVVPGYDSTYTDADVSAYQKTVQRITGMMEADWSDMEKLLFLHDYLVTHCEYDLSYERYSAYDALVVGSSVCQGYAEAFHALCARSGIASSLISSRTINHAWNLVMVGGENFYIDCTWDDPANQWYEGYCNHINFMRSRSALAENHDGTDWTAGARNVYTDVQTSTRFDDAWWTDVVTAVPMIGHTGAYTLSSNSNNFYLRDMRTGTVTSYRLPVSAVWPVFGVQYSNWNGNFCSFAAANGLFYFTLPTAVWSASPAGELSSVYTLTQNELSQGYAYGIVADGNALYYSVGKQACNTDFIRKALPIQLGPVTGECDGFAYEVLSDGTASITRCDKSGNVVIPGTLDGFTVTNLASKLFYGVSGVTSVTIPATVTGFGDDPADNNWDYVFSYCYDLTRITVEQGNPVFCSMDGVLYSKDQATLICYPCSRAGAVYHAQPQTVCCTAFASNRNLKFLFLDEPDAWWYTYAFYNDPALTVFYVPGGAAAQKADMDRSDGRVQNGSSNNLWCSLVSSESLCRLPAGLRVISSEAFRGTELPWAIVPAGCTRIEKNAFTESGLVYLQAGTDTVIENGALPDSAVVERR